MPLYSPGHARFLFRRVQDLARPVVRALSVSSGTTSEWKRELRVGVFVAVLGLTFLIFRLTDILSFDLLFLLQPKPATPEDVAIIYIDDASRVALKQPHGMPMDRRLHAQLIDTLRQAGSGTIVFDVLFEGTNDPAADHALAEAARRHGKVVVAADVKAEMNAGSLAWRVDPEPFPELKEVVAFGAVEEKDTRRHYRDPHLNPPLPSMAARAAEVALGKKPPADPPERWLNYYGPPGTIAWLSYHEVLGASNAFATTLKGKVVFVGAKPGIGPGGNIGDDLHETPYTRWTSLKTPGVDIEASAYLNIAREEWLSRPATWVELTLIIGLAFLLPLLLRPLSVTNASLTTLAVGAVVFLVAGLATHRHHIWFPWLVISGIEAPCALACALVLKLQRATREMARTSAALVPGVTPPAGAVPPPQTTLVIPPGVPEAPVISDYTMFRNIGSGAFGVVWLAQNIVGSYRAVKVVHRQKFEDERPFEREFEGIKHFEPVSRKHEGFVQILHVGRNRAAGFFYYVMELADDAGPITTVPENYQPRTAEALALGLLRAPEKIVPETYQPRTLSSELTRCGALPLHECLDLALQLSEALRFLHGEGLIHRDIKPGNIIYSGGRAKFADIGLVTQMGNDRTWVGTEGYFPPEGTGTAPADIFSLGKTLYRAYTGLAVNRFPDLPDALPPPDNLLLFQRLNRIIMQACEQEVSRRYASAGAMHADLKELVAVAGAR